MYLRKNRNLLESNLAFAQHAPAPVYEDNTACIGWGIPALLTSQRRQAFCFGIERGNAVIGGRERAKHIDIRTHYAHEVVQNGHMRLIRVPKADL